MAKSSERHPGYSFTDSSGETVRVPAATITPAARYVHEAMSREQASDIAIAFGVCTESEIPIRIRPVAAADGAIGWVAEVPLEWIAGLEDVSAFLEGKRWV